METKGKHDRPTDRLPDKQTVTHVTELFSAALVYFDIRSMDYWQLNFMAVTVDCLWAVTPRPTAVPTQNAQLPSHGQSAPRIYVVALFKLL